MTPSKDVKETENGSRWLTILDSWLPKDMANDQVDALLEDLSLDNEGDDQKRGDHLNLFTRLSSSSIRVHRYSVGRCLRAVWEHMHQLESGHVRKPADLPWVSHRSGLPQSAFPTLRLFRVWRTTHLSQAGKDECVSSNTS
jgi:hypothetical protein